MFKINICVVVMLYGFLVIAKGQDCIPMSVTNVSITFMGRLSWVVREEETCPISHFMVHMSEPDEDAKFIFKAFATTLNVDFLRACEEWHFNVVPYMNEIRGDDRFFITKIPVPQDADLSIGLINVTRPEEEGDLHLQWDLNNAFFGDCSLRYRLTVSADDEDIITDLYIDEKYINLNFLSPCVAYQFGLRAINSAPPTMEGPLRSMNYDYPPAVQTPPTLQSVSLGTTDVNLTFALEPLARNRCPIREFFVNGGVHFNVSLLVHDTDVREPVEVQLTSLRPNSMYLLRASVQNNAGWSDPSILAVQTLNLQRNSIN